MDIVPVLTVPVLFKRHYPQSNQSWILSALCWLSCTLQTHKLKVEIQCLQYLTFSLPALFPQHPCIQKESHYIKFLCCDNEHTLLLWVNSIRIAKVRSNTTSNTAALHCER